MIQANRKAMFEHLATEEDDISLKAYRALEHEGLVAGRPGVGTFVTKSLARVPGGAHRLGARSLARWVVKARGVGLLDDDIRALLESTLRAERVEGVA